MGTLANRQKTDRSHEWIEPELVARVGCATNTGNKNVATLYNIDSINNMLSVTLIQSLSAAVIAGKTSAAVVIDRYHVHI